MFVPVTSIDGPDTPTYVVVTEASGAFSNGYLATSGTAFCYADGGTNAGDYEAANYNSGFGTSVCHDIGATLPTSCTWVVGQSQSTVFTPQNIALTVIGQWYGCGGGSGANGVQGNGTINVLPIWTNSLIPGTVGNSSESENFNTLITTATNGLNATQVVTQGSLSQSGFLNVPNDGSTGTVQYKLAKIVSNTAIRAATTDINVHLFAVAAPVTSDNIIYQAGTTGSAPLIRSGQAILTADAGGITTNHYVGPSTTTAGDIEDIGAGPVFIGTVACFGKAAYGAISGSATGDIDVGNCPPGASGSSSAQQALNGGPYVVATLPATPAAGTLANVSDGASASDCTVCVVPSECDSKAKMSMIVYLT